MARVDELVPVLGSGLPAGRLACGVARPPASRRAASARPGRAAASPAATSASALGAEHTGERIAAGHAQQRTLRRHRAGGRTRDAAGQGRYLGSVRTMYRQLATARGCASDVNQLGPSRLHQARTAGARAEPGLGLGHQCAMKARFATTREKGGTKVSEPKLADSRPAAAMLPRTGGDRAKGGCKARPFADGWVSCAEQPELYRAGPCGLRVGLPQGLW